MPHIKVLVVDDSLFMRRMIARFIEEEADMSVVGQARNGEEGVRMAMELKPDVVTMDVEMPILNGLQALAAIMKQRPVPVVMLSSLTRAGADETIEALQTGAVDFFCKPGGAVQSEWMEAKRELTDKIRSAAGARPRPSGLVLAAAIPVKAAAAEAPPMRPVSGAAARPFAQIAAIGASTGGPRALAVLLNGLPADLSCPLLIVQHMPPNFTHSLAARLDASSAIRVVEAANGEAVKAGTAYIAPGGRHMTVIRKGGEVRLVVDDRPPRSNHRPSVDELFESLAGLQGFRKHYVLLTGMGSDGAAGMEAGKRAGAASTIAESKETCVVYGMPKAAVERGCVDIVAPVGEIARRLQAAVSRNGDFLSKGQGL